jgi:DMSO/TMAO reductase YedYZ heme-binding membrane subunit
MATLITAIVVLVAVLVVTKTGRDIDAATQRFMLYYAGVLALVGLTGSVLLGLVATDRIVMTPGHRVMAQAVHRAFSFGTLAFLIIHIVTEILAQRSHIIDAVVPFLSPYRTFYIGLGTIASDLIVLLVVTSILRKRFTAHGRAWRWRAIHYTSYVAFVFAVLHGLLGGRTAKPYVDWSYGFAIAVTALGLAVRFLAISLRPKESLPSSPSAGRVRPAGSSSLHAAAMSMARAQLGSTIGGTVQVLPAGLGGRGTTDSWTALPAPGRSTASGPLPALGPAPAYAGPPPDAYHDLGFTPLGAPPYGDDGPAGMRGRLYVSADQPRPALAGPNRQPRYEPGYDGPPRFEGAPRGHGDIPQDELSSHPYGPPARRPQAASPYPEDYPDRPGSGARATRPAMAEPARPRAAIPAPPRTPDRGSGPIPQLRTGSMAQPGTGPLPRPDTGPLPRAGQGPPPRNGVSPGTGPLPRADSGPMPRPGTGPLPRFDTGPLPRTGQGPPPRNGVGPGTGPMPRAGTGPLPRADSGPMPRPGTGPLLRFDTGPMPRPDTGGMPSRPATGPMPRADSGPMPRLGPMPHPDQPWPAGDPATGPRTGPSRTARRGSHRAKHTDPRYRDMPGPTGGDEWR